MNRFKVNVAKEKISRLKEKYLQSKPLEKSISSSESLISIQSTKSADSGKGDLQKITTVEKTLLINTDDDVSSPRVTKVSLKGENQKENISKTDLESNIQESVFDVVEQSFEKPLSSGSLVLSELSNQFECIRFISSSSEDLSIVESENTPTNSVSTSTIHSVTFLEQSRHSSDEERENSKVKESSKVVNNIEKHISIKSSSESEGSINVSSIKELLTSESESGNMSHGSSLLLSAKDSNACIRNKNAHEQEYSTDVPLQNIEINKLKSNMSSTRSSIKVNVTSVNAATLFKERKLSTDSETDNSSRSTSRHVHIKHNGERKAIDVSSGKASRSTSSSQSSHLQNLKDTMCREHVDKSTNTDPVKVSVLKSTSKHRSHKHISNVNNRLNRKIKKYQLSKKQGFNVNKNSQRDFIKPCNLITQDELKTVESKSVKRKELHSLKFGFTDDICNHPILGTSGTSCDEVISLLLRNQIQLTRHFMESHQRMYLQVSEAAQLLNKNYQPS